MKPTPYRSRYVNQVITATPKQATNETATTATAAINASLFKRRRIRRAMVGC